MTPRRKAHLEFDWAESMFITMSQWGRAVAALLPGAEHHAVLCHILVTTLLRLRPDIDILLSHTQFQRKLGEWELWIVHKGDKARPDYWLSGHWQDLHQELTEVVMTEMCDQHMTSRRLHAVDIQGLMQRVGKLEQGQMHQASRITDLERLHLHELDRQEQDDERCDDEKDFDDKSKHYQNWEGLDGESRWNRPVVWS